MNGNQLLGSVRGLAVRLEHEVLEVLPNLAGAAIIMGCGLAMALVLRYVVRRLITGLDRVVPGKRTRSVLRAVGMQRSAADVIGTVAYWIVIAFFATAATETLGLPVVTTWLSGVALYLPRLLSAVLIVFAGIIGGAMLRDLVGTAAAGAGLLYGHSLGRVAQLAAVLTGVLIAAEQVGLDVRFLTTTGTVALATVLLGGAMAFGLGARTEVSNILAAHRLRKVYDVGQQVRIGEWEGEIVEINSNGVLLRAEAGQVLIPARQFSEQTSILLNAGA